MLAFCAPLGNRPLRILVVDDEPDVRLMFRIGLGKEPEIEVSGEAADGAEAVAMVTDDCPDAVLLDIRMPVMDGIEASKQIKDLCPDIKILVISAQPVAPATMEELSESADLFLEKTTPIRRIKDAVVELCA